MGIPYVFAAYCPDRAAVATIMRRRRCRARRDAGTGARRQPRAVGAQRGALRTQTFRDVAQRASRASLGLAAGGRRARLHVHRSAVARGRPDAGALARPMPTRAVYQTGALDPAATSGRCPVTWRRFWMPASRPIFFGFGSGRAPQNAGQAIVDAARALGRRAIVSKGWADLSGEDERARLSDRRRGQLPGAVPAHGGRRAPRRRGHDGGGAARAGAPSILVPLFADQHYFAGRVHGARHRYRARAGGATESLTAALEQALRAGGRRSAASPRWPLARRRVGARVRPAMALGSRAEALVARLFGVVTRKANGLFQLVESHRRGALAVGESASARAWRRSTRSAASGIYRDGVADVELARGKSGVLPPSIRLTIFGPSTCCSSGASPPRRAALRGT